MTEKSGKRRYGIIAACAVLALVLTAGAYRLGRSAGGGADIGEEAAKLAALGHAQVSEASLTRYGISRDRNSGRTVYEVEFTADGVEYDYEINAADGSVIGFQKELDGAALPVETPQAPAEPDPAAQTPDASTAPAVQTPAAPSTAGDIGEARAWEIAYGHAGVAAGDAAVSPAKVDYEDGVRVYELEFFAGGYEYDYEINAADGSVLKFEKEVDDRAPAAQVSSGDSAGMGIPADSASGDAAYIGEARAREIAYAHAGVAAGDVLHCDMELDHHDHHGAHHGAGCCAYEIDFKCGGYEYGYEVDALTGEILKSQREVDD